MRRLIVGSLLLLGPAGCSSVQRPSWLESADFLVESPKEFMTNTRTIEPK